MARIDVETSVTAPAKITVPLVRADHHHTSGVFRFTFEIFLAMSAMLGGHILSIQDVPKLTWLSLVVCVITAIGFLICTVVFARKSRDV